MAGKSRRQYRRQRIDGRAAAFRWQRRDRPAPGAVAGRPARPVGTTRCERAAPVAVDAGEPSRPTEPRPRGLNRRQPAARGAAGVAATPFDTTAAATRAPTTLSGG